MGDSPKSHDLITEEQAAALRELSRLQGELRGLLSDRIRDSGLSMNAFAAQQGINHAALGRFIKQLRALCSGKTLATITAIVGRDDLRAAIEAAVRTVPSPRLLSMTAFPLPVVECVLAIRAAYATRSEGRLASFAERFAPYQHVVTGAVVGTHAALMRLMKEAVRTAILNTLSGAAPPTRGTGPPLDDLLHKIGGVQSPDGTPYVLTTESFQLIEGDPGDAYVALLIKHVQMTRALLNVGAQLGDDRVRGAIRRRLDGELAELHNSLQLFSFEVPNRLTTLYDAQRASMSQPRPRSRTARKEHS